METPHASTREGKREKLIMKEEKNVFVLKIVIEHGCNG